MRQQNPVVMATRIGPDVYQKLKAQIPNLYYYEIAKICAIQPSIIPEAIAALIPFGESSIIKHSSIGEPRSAAAFM